MLGVSRYFFFSIFFIGYLINNIVIVFKITFEKREPNEYSFLFWENNRGNDAGDAGSSQFVVSIVP